MENSNVVKKAKEYMFLSESLNPTTVAAFFGRVNNLLAEGWDILNSQSIGLDTGGGNAGSGNIMMVVSLVRYDYLKIMDAPATADVSR